MEASGDNRLSVTAARIDLAADVGRIYLDQSGSCVPATGGSR
jgi:hypothetical protein